MNQKTQNDDEEPRIEAPSEVAIPGMPGATDQPPTQANAMKVAATAASVPEALELEEQQSGFFREKKKADEQDAVVKPSTGTSDTETDDA